MTIDSTVGTKKTGRAGIYMMACLVSGRFYIGSSAHLRARFSEHASELKGGDHPNRHLQNAWSKYGKDQFVFTVLEYCSPEMLLIREQWYLDEWRPYDKTIGYNNAPEAASNRGVRHSEETKQKIGQRNRGRIKSPETIEKLRQMWVANYDDWQQQSIDSRGISFEIVSPTGQTHKVKGLNRFAREHGLDRCHLARVIKGKNDSIRGWHLPSFTPRPDYAFSNPIGETVSVRFGELTGFCRQHGLKPFNMGRMHNGHQKTHCGWTKHQEAV